MKHHLIRLVVVASVLLSFTGMPAFAQNNVRCHENSPAMDWVTRAYREITDENYEQAITLLSCAIKLSPDFPMAYLLRARAYWGSGDFLEALDDYNRVIELNPKNPLALTERAQIYANLGDPQNAIMDLEAAIELEPDYMMAHFGLGNAYSMAGEYENAVTSYKRALLLDPEYINLYWGMGAAYDHLTYYDQALSFYRRYLDMAGDEAVVGIRNRVRFLENLLGIIQHPM